MLQSKYSKIALCAASGTLAAVTAAGPALATTTPEASAEATPMTTPMTTTQEAAKGDRDHRYYKGRVVSRIDLNVRAHPTRHSKVVGSLRPGEIVKIKCKVNSKDVVHGNPRWYRLTDGRHAWAAARYIQNIGKAPHWCHR